MQDKLELKGRIRREVSRTDGRKEVEEWENTIQAGIKEALIDCMSASATNIALDNLFSANMDGKQYGDAIYDPDGFDGILIVDEMNDKYAIDMSSSGLGISQPSATTLQAKGKHTATGDETIMSARLGHNLATVDAFETTFATASSWTSLTLASGDSVTITWQLVFN